MRGHDGSVETDVGVLRVLTMVWGAFNILMGWLYLKKYVDVDDVVSSFFSSYALIAGAFFIIGAIACLLFLLLIFPKQNWRGLILSIGAYTAGGLGVSCVGIFGLLYYGWTGFSGIHVADILFAPGAMVIVPFLFLRQFRILLIEAPLVAKK